MLPNTTIPMRREADSCNFVILLTLASCSIKNIVITANSHIMIGIMVMSKGSLNAKTEARAKDPVVKKIFPKMRQL